MIFRKTKDTLLTILILFSFDCVGAQSNTIRGNNMDSTSNPVISFLSQNEERYKSMTDRDISDLELEMMDVVETEDGIPTSNGAWLACPEYITENQPMLLMGLLYSGIRAWKVDPIPNIFLILRNLESGEAWYNTPFYSPRRRQIKPRSESGDKPDALNSGIWYPDISKIDLNEQFSVSLSNGNYAITGLYFDLKSNSASFTYSKDKECPKQKNIFFPEFTFSKNDSKELSIKINIETGKSNISIWRINVIALKVDEDPIIVPFEIDLSTEKEGVIIDIPTDNENWGEGKYVVYLDGGKEIKGPIEVQVNP